MTVDPQKAKAIFLAAVENQSPDKWAEYLDQACGGDTELRQWVEELLTAHGGEDSLLDCAQRGRRVNPSPTEDAPITEKPGTVIGPYKLLQKIGEGGFGVVYMADQTEPVKRRVALKIIKPGMDTRQVIARFEAERQALAMMDHPNIAKVLDAGTTDSGRPYFVMDLVKGVPITQYCDEHHLTPRERLELFVPVCQAIQHAHQKGVIHRDIKPTNVLVAEYDDRAVPKVIDFGVAKATEQRLTEKTMFTQLGQIVGTIDYMSPEQAKLNELDIDTRSEVYSLGVLLYELLTGETPFDRQRLRSAAFDELLRIIREEDPPKPSLRLSTSESLPSIAANRHTEPNRLSTLVRGELDWIVMKALEKDRARRYETANGFARDIERYLNDEPVTACPPSAGYRFRKFARRNKMILSTAAVVAVALLLGIAGTTWQAIRATRAAVAERQAQEEANRAWQAEARQRTDAEEARRRAEQRRVEAEENFQRARQAVDRYFTLVSENTLLDEPGLQPLRKDLLQAAVSYYEDFAKRRSDDPNVQVDLAMSYLHLAQVYHQMRSFGASMSPLERGFDLVEDIVREHPDASDLHLKLAGFWKGGRCLALDPHPVSEPLQAMETFRKGIDLWETFVQEHPAVTGFQSDLSKFYHLMSRQQSRVGQTDEALRSSKKMVKIRETIVHDNPGNAQHLSELAFGYYFLATVLEPSDPAEAERHYHRALKIREDLPDLPEHQKDLGQFHLNLGKFYERQNRLDEALRVYDRARAIFDELATQFPYVTEYQQRASNAIMAKTSALRRLANLYLGEGEWRKGQAALEEVVTSETATHFEHYQHALLCLVLEKAPNYRDACAAMVREFRDTDDLMAANFVAWTCALAPDAVADYGPLLACATRAVEARPKSDQFLNTLGAILYRAGCREEAIEWLAVLDRPLKRPDAKASSLPAYNWYFLAMGHNKAGSEEKAREYLDKANQVTDETLADEENPPLWNDRATLELLRKEAEALVAACDVRPEPSDHKKPQPSGDVMPSLSGPYQWVLHVRRARRFAAEENWTEAASAFSKAINFRPDDWELWKGRGEAHEKLDQWDEAIADYAKAIELDPNRWSAYLHRGVCFVRLNRFEDALKEYAKAIEVNPENAETYCLRGEAYLALGRYDEALADCNRYVELKPHDAVAALIRAQILLMADRREEYRQTCLEMLDRFALSDCHAARACVLAPKAILDPMLPVELADWAVSRNPREWTLYTLGMAHLRAGQLEEAADRFQESVEKGPDWPARFLNWLGLALVHHQRGETEETRQWLGKGVELMEQQPPSLPQNRIEGQVLRRELEQLLAGSKEQSDSAETEQAQLEVAGRGEPERAVAHYTKAIELDPDNAQLYVTRGNIHFTQERWAQAAADFTNAIELEPKLWPLWKVRAQLFGHCNQWESAIDLYTALLKLNSNNSELWRARGKAYAELKRWDKAIQDYGRVIKRRPEHAEAWRARGDKYRDMRRYEDAVSDYNEAIRLDPDNPGLYAARAEAYLGLGRYDEALADCNRYVELYPDDPKAALIRAQMLLMADRTEEYRQACGEILDRFGQSQNAGVFCHAARACVLAPKAIPDPMVPVELAERAVSRNPRGWTLYTLGMAYFRAGQLDQAAQHLQESLEVDPSWDARFLNWLGLALVHHERGETEEAGQWLGKALDLMEQHPARARQGRIEGQLLRREVEQLLGKSEQEKDDADSEEEG